MRLVTSGISHHSTPLDIRERLAFARDDFAREVTSLRGLDGVEEAVLVSTCNRTEIYAAVSNGHERRISEWLVQRSGLPAESVAPHLYHLQDREAVRHLFQVASGMDSMVLGEAQIVGQLKDAWQAALDVGAAGKLTDRLFQHAFAASKVVRSETGISQHPVSVAYIATVLARQIFGDLSTSTVLLVGAGDMVSLCGRHFREQGVQRLLVANRSMDRAEAVAAALSADPFPLTDLGRRLGEADIVITSTASREPVVSVDQVKLALRQRRHQPMFMVDLAVPRDIDPRVGKLDDIYLYSIDDLHQVADENLGQRERAARDADGLVDTAVTQYMGWLHGARAADSLRRLRAAADRNSAELASRALHQIEAGGDPAQVVQQLANTLTHRLLHGPSRRLREAAEQQHFEFLKAADWLFEDVDDPEPEQ
jgi:glutamyl-tRNA reductase